MNEVKEVNHGSSSVYQMNSGWRTNCSITAVNQCRACRSSGSKDMTLHTDKDGSRGVHRCSVMITALSVCCPVSCVTHPPIRQRQLAQKLRHQRHVWSTCRDQDGRSVFCLSRDPSIIRTVAFAALIPLL